jgi:hypothetical protein
MDNSDTDNKLIADSIKSALNSSSRNVETFVSTVRASVKDPTLSTAAIAQRLSMMNTIGVVNECELEHALHQKVEALHRAKAEPEMEIISRPRKIVSVVDGRVIVKPPTISSPVVTPVMAPAQPIKAMLPTVYQGKVVLIAPTKELLTAEQGAKLCKVSVKHFMNKVGLNFKSVDHILRKAVKYKSRPNGYCYSPLYVADKIMVYLKAKSAPSANTNVNINTTSASTILSTRMTKIILRSLSEAKIDLDVAEELLECL